MVSSAWRLDRRTLLRGLGFGVSLPWLEAMGTMPAAAEAAPGGVVRPRRFCAFFFGNGVALPGKDKPEHQEWHWFPHTDGAEYQFTKPLEPLAARREFGRDDGRVAIDLGAGQRCDETYDALGL